MVETVVSCGLNGDFQNFNQLLCNTLQFSFILHYSSPFFHLQAYLSYSGVGVGGGGGGGGGCNLGLIVVRVYEPVFQNLPHSYT